MPSIAQIVIRCPKRLLARLFAVTIGGNSYSPIMSKKLIKMLMI
jgi:hypothetical protein